VFDGPGTKDERRHKQNCVKKNPGELKHDSARKNQVKKMGNQWDQLKSANGFKSEKGKN